MKRISNVITVIIILWGSLAYGFSTNNTTISRVFDSTEVPVNVNVTVTVSFSNGETGSLRGFFYTEHIPQGMTVTPVSVRIDGQPVSDYIFESGSAGNVYQAATPYRWVFETPTGFFENNPINPGSVAEIVYTVSASGAGTFNLDEFSWAGYYSNVSSGAFGHSELADRTVLIITATCTDSDGDGYAVEGGECGAVDCNDNNRFINPGATDNLCDGTDDDCDGVSDDGYVPTTTSCGVGICVSVGQMVCNNGLEVDTCVSGLPQTEGPLGDVSCSDGMDNDCDGSTDGGDPGCLLACLDGDGDGYGSPGNPACPNGSADDCNDGVSSVNPGASEACNGIDDNCNGSVDEGVTNTYHRDADGDGYGDPAVTFAGCTAPRGFVSDGSDCNDGNSSVNPGAREACGDLRDNDCDGFVDCGDGACSEDPACMDCADEDDDGFFTGGSDCGAVDCDDTNSSVNPGASEACNGIDDNCNGIVDEGVRNTYHRDGDGDGYGDPAVTSTGCTSPGGFVSDGSDCNDDIASVNPGAQEACSDQTDNNCDGLTDCFDGDCSEDLLCISDIDGDGMPDFIEWGPDGNDTLYDGNGDTIPDSQQDNVGSLHTYDRSHYVTFVFPGTIQNFGYGPPPSDLPPELELPFGVFEFTIDDLDPGADATVMLYLDDGADSYFKYGGTPGEESPHWYDFTFDSLTGTGAEINGVVVTLHLVDGDRGDDDLVADGTIIDQGGPAVVSNPPPVASATGGGGCSINGPLGGVVNVLESCGFLIVPVFWLLRRGRRRTVR